LYFLVDYFIRFYKHTLTF